MIIVSKVLGATVRTACIIGSRSTTKAIVDGTRELVLEPSFEILVLMHYKVPPTKNIGNEPCQKFENYYHYEHHHESPD